MPPAPACAGFPPEALAFFEALGADVAAWAHLPPGPWPHGPEARDAVAERWRACGPLCAWLDRHAGPRDEAAAEAAPGGGRLGVIEEMEAAGAGRNRIAAWTRWGWIPPAASAYGYNLRRSVLAHRAGRHARRSAHGGVQARPRRELRGHLRRPPRRPAARRGPPGVALRRQALHAKRVAPRGRGAGRLRG